MILANLLAATLTLAPNQLEKLPLGAIRPEGWLKYQLDLQKEGLPGRLQETSPYLAPGNAWLCPKVQAKLGSPLDAWEEAGYWFRAFVRLAALTEDQRLLGVAKDLVEKLLATVDAEGWFGSQAKKATAAQWRGDGGSGAAQLFTGDRLQDPCYGRW